ncbi:MAG: hydroxyacylglutathione hydrolase, partial [Pseudomonadota bacterium]
ADTHRLPSLDRALTPGETFTLCGAEVQVFDVSGHTLGHLAYHMPAARALFAGDSLMACGCGRLFEGTPTQMWQSLKPLRELPSETLVYSGHEYTQGNVAFAVTQEPDNTELQRRASDTEAARAVGTPTVPSSLTLELATNPFLRVDLPEFQEALDMVGSPAEEVFAVVRGRKDNF